MFDMLIEGLAKQGAMGVLLALLMMMFVRFFNKTFDAQVERDRSITQFMQNVLATMQEIKSSCAGCRNEIVSSSLRAVGESEEKVVKAVSDTATHVIGELRRDNDLSRPHSLTPSPTPIQPYPPVEAVSRRAP